MGKKESSMKGFFYYMTKKYNIVCEYPTIFNGKQISYFDEEGRPFDENDVDLIDDYWCNIEGGFSVNGGDDAIKKLEKLNLNSSYNNQNYIDVNDLSPEQKTSLRIDSEHYNYKGDKMRIINDDNQDYQYNSEVELYDAIIVLDTVLKSPQTFTLKEIFFSEEIKNKMQVMDKLNYNLYEKLEDVKNIEMSGEWDINKAETRLFILSDDDIAYHYTVQEKILVDVIVDDSFTNYAFYIADNTLFVPMGLLKEVKK